MVTVTSKETSNMINTVVQGVNKFIYLGGEVKNPSNEHKIFER
jgi:hypothetical protein